MIYPKHKKTVSFIMYLTLQKKRFLLERVMGITPASRANDVAHPNLRFRCSYYCYRTDVMAHQYRLYPSCGDPEKYHSFHSLNLSLTPPEARGEYGGTGPARKALRV